ncbi:Der GTPase-activating protein YihI [Shewanella gaetbuli]|uniref:Der GTPase-activating protein YihI n=1 Tax=Shewanella gaetbuli TaxID=220752 RepID=A0A9X1ZI32_9GAMM|nr:Der GTPase-activating protein YihI [Shewanella gaetbuli]MCL1142734.1 Der GTPase-activating protein YihI [Shewanella gaetbuli]
MARSKKTRKGGENGPKFAPRVKKADRNTPEGKRSEKGRKPGNRHNESLLKQNAPNASGKSTDPRHGSKKPVALAPVAKPNVTAEKAKPKQPKMTDEQKLLKLEEDPRLNKLLDMLEEGRELSAEDQKWLDSQLDKIEHLMNKLGLNETESAQKPAKTSNKAVDSDDDLLARFESGENILNDYFSKD